MEDSGLRYILTLFGVIVLSGVGLTIIAVSIIEFFERRKARKARKAMRAGMARAKKERET